MIIRYEIYDSRIKQWCQNEQTHRLYGPAIEWDDGTKAWYQNDLIHRTDGPALEYSDGRSSWFIKGKERTKEEYNLLISK